jgi:hypothetical protein
MLTGHFNFAHEIVEQTAVDSNIRLDLPQVSLVNFGFTSGFFRIPLTVIGESDLNRALPITSAFR